MPNPKNLRVGDKVRFIDTPKEWADPEYKVSQESKRFMKYMLMRNFPSQVYEIDELGHPWISARLKINGKTEHHFWAITEKTGWRKVKKRS